MRHFKVISSSAHARPSMFVFFGVTLLISVLLASCGGPATTQKPTQSKPTATVTSSPTRTTSTSTATPTHTAPPTLTPTPTPTPFPPLQQGSVILDLKPASTSIVGKTNCIDLGGLFNCHTQIFSKASNPGPLHWTASTDMPGQITFSPSIGTLAPGQSILVTIFVPDTDCTHGQFFFRGQSNMHTITWACS